MSKEIEAVNLAVINNGSVGSCHGAQPTSRNVTLSDFALGQVVQGLVHNFAGLLGYHLPSIFHIALADV